MNNEIQHHLVHARDLAQTAAQLYQAARDANDSGVRDRLARTAEQLLNQADRLLEETS